MPVKNGRYNPHRPWPSLGICQAALELALSRHPEVTEDDVRSRSKRRRVLACRREWWALLAETGRYSISGIARRTGGFDHSTVLQGLNKHAGEKRSWRATVVPGNHAPETISPMFRVIAVRQVEYGPMEASG